MLFKFTLYLLLDYRIKTSFTVKLIKANKDIKNEINFLHVALKHIKADHWSNLLLKRSKYLKSK